MAIYKQEPPFAIQVELSEGCNLACDFCGLQGIRTAKVKNFKFMKVSTAYRLAKQIKDAGWTSRIEFAMHGEPTMNPQWIEIIGVFRDILPNNQLMMTSNGGGLLGKPGPLWKLNAAFQAGLNIFAFDAYESVELANKIMKPISKVNDRIFDIHWYPKENISPHSRYPKSTKKFIHIQDISKASEGTHSTLSNHAGAAFPPNQEGHGKRCAKPFRELSVRWNGAIALCCNDWRGVYKIGTILKSRIDQLWNSKRFDAARRYLIKGDRASLQPCDGCDAVSYRVGLLPDKKGKDRLPNANKLTQQIVKEATSGRSLTAKVKRPWEK